MRGIQVKQKAHNLFKGGSLPPPATNKNYAG